MSLDVYGPNPVKTKPNQQKKKKNKQQPNKDDSSSSGDVYTRL